MENRTTPNTYSPGEKVYVYKPSQIPLKASRKLGPTYAGPFVIVKTTFSGCYVRPIDKPNAKLEYQNICNLKRAYIQTAIE